MSDDRKLSPGTVVAGVVFRAAVIWWAVSSHGDDSPATASAPEPTATERCIGWEPGEDFLGRGGGSGPSCTEYADDHEDEYSDYDPPDYPDDSYDEPEEPTPNFADQGQRRDPPCDPSYPTVCIPSPPPVVDCGVTSARNFPVVPPDPHGLDHDFDGIGCEPTGPPPPSDPSPADPGPPPPYPGGDLAFR